MNPFDSIDVILISEDSGFAEGLLRGLEAAGLRARLFAGPAAFLPLLAGAERPKQLQCVISELNMRSGSGEKLLQELRSGPWQELPVVLMASMLDQPTVKRLIEAGVDGILCKPFQPEAVLRAVRTARERRETKELSRLLRGV